MNRRQPQYSKGQRIGGRFLIHQALMGGMGEVYLCLDEQDFMPLALKTFQGSNPALADIFRREVASWIALEKHPNIVRCFWMQKFDNIPFMGLEWVVGEESKGTDLRSWLRRGLLDLPLALRFTIDIVRGLIHANEKSPGIVHRDLKPDNVLVNGSRQAKITDFGLATAAQIAKLDTDEMTQADTGQSRYIGNMVGTPAYMSPEQWRGDPDIDFRADVYSIGCILYELLTGNWLYDARTISELRAQHLESPIPALNDSFPLELRHILDGCLAKKREDRYEGLELLFEDLKEIHQTHIGEALPEVTAGEFSANDYVNRGVTYANLGQYEQAILDFDLAIQLDPNSASAYSNRGNSYADLRQHERAIQDYDAAIRLDPNEAKAYYNRGNSYMALGQHERAIHDHDRTIQLDPNLARAYTNRGTSYANLGWHKQAIADFDEAIRCDPHYTLAYYNRGNSYSLLRQPEQAIADFDECIRLNPNYVPAYSNRGTSYATLGRHERAIDDFNRALEINPKDVFVYYNRGNSLTSLDRHEAAIEDYNQVCSSLPEFAMGFSNRGKCFSMVGQYDKAISDYTYVIEKLDSSSAVVFINRGLAFAKLERYADAILDFTRALELDASFLPAYVNRANVLCYFGRYEEAIVDYTYCIANGFEHALVFTNRGIAYAELGLFDEALTDYSRTMSLDSSYWLAHYHRHLTYKRQGLADLAYEDEVLLDKSEIRKENTRPQFHDTYERMKIGIHLAGDKVYSTERIVGSPENTSRIINDSITEDDNANPERVSDAVVEAQQGRDDVTADAQDSMTSSKLPISYVSVESSAQQIQEDTSSARKGMINQFSVDLTAQAGAGDLPSVIGRLYEMMRVVKILGRDKKNCPVLVGAAGVGKTAIVEGLAQRIAVKNIHPDLHNKRIVQLDASALVAGTKYHGELEERMTQLIAEISADPNLILFIDEIHLLVGAGAGGSGVTDAANILKPALANGSMRLIGAATDAEYRQYIEKDAALERRFELVRVVEPSAQETVEMLVGARVRLQEKHGVTILNEAIIAAVELSVRYITDRFLPDKAFTLLDDACAEARYGSMLSYRPDQMDAQQAINTVTADTVRAVLENRLGIQVTDDRERVMRMGDELRQRIIGQDAAIDAVAQIVQRHYAGMSAPNRPVGVFLFTGPTGVGKTELAKATAAFLFHDEKRLIRLDMGEYMEKHNVARLIGVPPGYIGYEQSGQLTNALREKLAAVVLIDEIEKAHPDVLSVFLSLFDNGRLTDGQGRTVDGQNALFIMTSNLGHTSADATPTPDDVKRAVYAHLHPEFINRIDALVYFQPLGATHMEGLVRIQFERLVRQLERHFVDLEASDEAVQWLATRGYNPQMGARSLIRLFEDHVVTPISHLILIRELVAGEAALVRVQDDTLIIERNSTSTNY